MEEKEKIELSKAIGRYMFYCGCHCCSDGSEMNKAEEDIERLLGRDPSDDFNYKKDSLSE